MGKHNLENFQTQPEMSRFRHILTIQMHTAEDFTVDTGQQGPKLTDVDLKSFRLEQNTDIATQQQHQEMTDVDRRSTRLEQITDTATE